MNDDDDGNVVTVVALATLGSAKFILMKHNAFTWRGILSTFHVWILFFFLCCLVKRARSHTFANHVLPISNFFFVVARLVPSCICWGRAKGKKNDFIIIFGVFDMENDIHVMYADCRGIISAHLFFAFVRAVGLDENTIGAANGMDIDFCTLAKFVSIELIWFAFYWRYLIEFTNWGFLRNFVAVG